MQKDYFEELISLSKEKKARFKIEGNATKFRLKCNTDNALICIILILEMSFPTFFLIQNYQNPTYWLI